MSVCCYHTPHQISSFQLGGHLVFHCAYSSHQEADSETCKTVCSAPTNIAPVALERTSSSCPLLWRPATSQPLGGTEVALRRASRGSLPLSWLCSSVPPCPQYALLLASSGLLIATTVPPLCVCLSIWVCLCVCLSVGCGDIHCEDDDINSNKNKISKNRIKNRNKNNNN